MVAVGLCRFQEIGQALRKPAQVRMFRWPCPDIGMPHLVEHLVTEIEVQQLVVVAHGLDQPRAVGIAIDAEQRLAFLFGAIENLGQNRIVSGQNAALERALLPRKIAHPASLPGSTCSAIARVRMTSSSSSSSGGMLSSRSIMVETRPKRFNAAT